MEIREKVVLKAVLQEKVEKNIRQFPFYFWFNIVINAIIVFSLVGIILTEAVSFSSYELNTFGWTWPTAAFLVGISYVTLGGFFKNLEILRDLRRIHFGMDVKDYEWDHLVQFVYDLPMKIEDAEKMKISLSFGKLINILDLFGIITFENGMCCLDRIFQREVEKLAETKERIDFNRTQE